MSHTKKLIIKDSVFKVKVCGRCGTLFRGIYYLLPDDPEIPFCSQACAANTKVVTDKKKTKKGKK